MISQLPLQANAVSSNVLSNTADEILAILEAQLSAFRSIYDISVCMKERFAQSGGEALKDGLQKRSVYLEHAQELERELKSLKLEWNAFSDVPLTEQDARINQLVDDCQKVIGQIVELDRSLNQAATAKQKILQSSLAGIHQRRQPLATYLGAPALSSSYSIPVSGRNVHFSEA